MHRITCGLYNLFKAFCGRRAHHYPKFVSLLIVSRNLNLIWTEAAVTTEKIEATEKMRIFIEKEYTKLSKNPYITEDLSILLSIKRCMNFIERFGNLHVTNTSESHQYSDVEAILNDIVEVEYPGPFIQFYLALTVQLLEFTSVKTRKMLRAGKEIYLSMNHSDSPARQKLKEMIDNLGSDYSRSNFLMVVLGKVSLFKETLNPFKN